MSRASERAAVTSPSPPTFAIGASSDIRWMIYINPQFMRGRARKSMIVEAGGEVDTRKFLGDIVFGVCYCNLKK